jgi:hypothetical protein
LDHVIGHPEEDDDADDPKWAKEVQRVMRQRNLTSGDAVNGQICRKEPENQ